MPKRGSNPGAAPVGPVPYARRDATRPSTRPPLPSLLKPLLKRLGLVALTVALLALAYAPFRQFYLAWIGFVPWFVLVGRARSKRAVFLWSWLTGYCFFISNL